MKTGACFSKCRKYRYSLWRIWDESKPPALIIGLNPSTADERKNDPTIRRCINFSREWGFGGLYMVNLFAFRATKPSDLRKAKEPIGPDNDLQIKTLAKSAGIVLAAWGNDGAYQGRSKEMTDMLPNLKCLKINRSGEPAHPLYQPKSATPINL